MALHVSKEPRGRAEFGEVRKDSMSSDDAAITAGSMSAEMIFAAERSCTEAAMSSTWRGRSSMNRSMEQSLTVHVVSDLLQVSLSRCWPSLAEEWWNRIGRRLIQARRF